MTLFQQIAAALNWNLRTNENFVSVSPAGLFGFNPASTTGLTWGYLGGNFSGISVANGTVALTASSTNYVVAARGTGLVSAATTTTNWLDSVNYLQLYQIVVGTSTITSYDDKRQAYGGSGSGSGGVIPNLLINGAFQVNQLQKSGTVTLTAGVYGHDGFKAGASGCTYTFAVTGGTTTLTITAGSLQQVVEGINLRTGTYALAWAGTAQGKVGASAYGASGVTGAFTGGTNGTVEWNTGTLSNVCLIPGTVAQSYVDIGYMAEFYRCERYCRRISLLNASGTPYAFMAQGTVTSTSTTAYAWGMHPVPMYAAPTFVLEDAAANYAIFDIIANVHRACSAVVYSTGNVQTNEIFYLTLTVPASTVGGPITLEKYANNLTLSARFEARL